MCPVHGRPEGGRIAVTQGGHSRLRERAEFVDERTDGAGVLLVAQSQAADGLTGAAVDPRVRDDQVCLFDALVEGTHPAGLEAYGVGGAGRRRVQPGRFSVRHLLGQLRQREQIIGGRLVLAGVQDSADDRARRGRGGTQAAFVGEIAARGDLEGLPRASRELPDRIEGPRDAGEPGTCLVHGAPVVETVQPRGAGDGCCRCVHR